TGAAPLPGRSALPPGSALPSRVPRPGTPRCAAAARIPRQPRSARKPHPRTGLRLAQRFSTPAISFANFLLPGQADQAQLALHPPQRPADPLGDFLVAVALQLQERDRPRVFIG